MAVRDRSYRIRKIIDEITFVIDDFIPNNAVSYWSILGKRHQWIFDVSAKDLGAHQLVSYIKQRYGIGVYTIISYNELGEIMSRRRVIIAEEDEEASDVSIKIAKSLLEREVYDVYTVVKAIESSEELNKKGGFINLAHLSEDWNISLERVRSISKKYCDIKEGYLKSKIFFTTIILSNGEKVPIIKRRRWDWLPF